MMTATDEPRYCPECETELVESTSERGDYWCTECGTPQRSAAALLLDPVCWCCGEIVADALPSSEVPKYCDQCREHGCDGGLFEQVWGCKYQQATTKPSECDSHDFVNSPGRGLKCRLCGLRIPAAGAGAPDEYGELWSDRRATVLDRDDRRCRSCGLSRNEHHATYGQDLHVHHIVPYRRFESDDDAHSPGNLVALCSDCHVDAEAMTADEQRELFDLPAPGP